MTKHRSKRLPIEQHQGGGIALDRTHRHAGRIQAVWAHLVGGGENLAVAELADWINVPGGCSADSPDDPQQLTGWPKLSQSSGTEIADDDGAGVPV